MSILKDENKTLFEQYDKDFVAIRTYFDILDADKSHYSSSNDVCTPLSLVKEMVDKVPKEFWKKKDLKILDCCCGNGNFHAYIGTKVSLDSLYFNEISEKRIENVYKYFGKDIHLTKKDFLLFDKNEEFDMVVANPPYASFTEDGERAAKNHNLSRPFIDKAIKCTKPGGYILFIVPDNWMSFSDRNDLPSLLSSYQFRYISIHTPKKYFPNVGSSFTFFLVQKIENTESFKVANGYKISDIQTVKLDKGVNFIPLYCSQLVLNILNKTVNDDTIEKYKVETSSDLHKYTKKQLLSNVKDAEHPYKVWHTPRQCYYSSVPHKYQDGYKVFISLTTQFETFIDNCGMTQSIAFIRCKNKEEARKIEKELSSPIYRFINNITRYGNFGNNRIWERMPILSKISLTPEEDDFIKKFNEIYSGSVKKEIEKTEEKIKENIKQNKTDRAIKSMDDLKNEINFSIYEYKDYFTYLCDIHPNKITENLEIINMQEEYRDKTGLIYILVIDDKIFKIGQTTQTFEDRISSYNCGKDKARKKGTCSVTNHYVLHSLLNLDKDVQVYVYIVPKAILEVFGERVESSEAPSKYTERLLIDDFQKKYSKKPIGSIQG